MRKSKLKIDHRHIRVGKCYTVAEIAVLLNVCAPTIRTWIRKGLQVLEGGKPLLIPGDCLKDWLKARAKSRKHACQPNELYCCHCRCPQKAKPWSVKIIPRNAKTVAIRALCGTCGTKMNKAGSLARLAQIETIFALRTAA